jgi:hypothetical protein
VATTTDPNVSYYQQVQADLGSSNPSLQEAGLLGASGAPTLAQSGLQLAQAEQQAGELTAAEAGAQNYQQVSAGQQLGGLGISAEQQALSNQETRQQYGITQEGFRRQASENELAYTRQLQSQIGGAAASGAQNTVGNKQAQADIGQQYAWEKQALGQQEQLSAGDYARSQQNQALLAKSNGLSQQEVYTRLAYGLSQLGVEYDPSSVLAQAGSALSGEASGMGSVLSQAGLLGGLNTVTGLG